VKPFSLTYLSSNTLQREYIYNYYYYYY